MVSARAWVIDALEALDHAHRNHIIHKDVRAANLLLDGAGNALLSDFGISDDALRQALESEERPYPPIVAPEVLGGAKATPSSDVWAAGYVLYQLLTGTYPYLTDDEVCSSGHVPAHKRSRQVPVALSKVVDCALAPAAERYQAAHEMIEDLSPLPLHQAWHRVDDAGVVEVWETDGPNGPYRAEVRKLQTGRYRVKASTTP